MIYDGDGKEGNGKMTMAIHHGNLLKDMGTNVKLTWPMAKDNIRHLGVKKTMWNPFRKLKKEEAYEETVEETAEAETEMPEAKPREDSRDFASEPGMKSESTEEPPTEPLQPEIPQGPTLIIRIVRGLFLALTALVPVWFLLFTAPGDVLATNKQVLIYGIVLASLVLWLVAVIRRGRLEVKLTGLEIGIGIWLGAWLLSMIFSVDSLRSLTAGDGFLTLAALALMVLVFTNFFESRDLPLIINWFLLGSLTAITTGLLVLFDLPVFGWLSVFSKQLTVGNQFNTVGSFNDLAALAALALVLAIAKLLTLGSTFDANWPRFWRTVTIALVIISAVLLLVVNWWTHYLILAAGMLAVVITPGLTEKITGAKVRLGAANIVIPLAILTLAMLLAGAGSFLDFRLPLPAKLPQEVSLNQTSSFEIAFRAVKARPVFGWGSGNFSLAYDKFKPSSINDTPFWNIRFNNPASEIWRSLAAGGLLGLAALAVLAAYAVRVMLAALRRGVANHEIYGLGVLPALAAGLALAALYPLSNITVLFSFWLVVSLAVLAGITGGAPAGAPPGRSFSIDLNNSSLKSVLTSFGLVIILISGLLGGYLLARKYRSEYYFARAARANIASRAEAEQTTAWLVKAVESGGREVSHLNGLGQLLLNRIGIELNNRADAAEEVTARLRNLAGNAVAVANRMTTDYKNDATAWSNAGFIYQNLIGLVDGADQAALNAYREARQRAPADPLNQTRIGQIFLTRAERNRTALAEADRPGQPIGDRKEIEGLIADDYKNAEENLRQAVTLKRDFAAALYNLGVVYERQNRIKDAVKQLELARDREVGNPGLAFELGLLYYRNNQKQNAFNEMSRAVALFKDFSNARWYLALMLEEKGQLDDAVSQLKEILKLEVNKNNQTVLDKLAALEAGKREIPPAKVTSKRPLEEGTRRQP